MGNEYKLGDVLKIKDLKEFVWYNGKEGIVVGKGDKSNIYGCSFMLKIKETEETILLQQENLEYSNPMFDPDRYFLSNIISNALENYRINASLDKHEGKSRDNSFKQITEKTTEKIMEHFAERYHKGSLLNSSLKKDEVFFGRKTT